MCPRLGRVEDLGLSGGEQRGCCGRDLVRRRWHVDEERKEGLGLQGCVEGAAWRQWGGQGSRVKVQGHWCSASDC